VVALAKVASMADRREYVGNLRAVNRVELRARVRGYLLEQLVEDGARVEKGDLLFRIDPSEFEVALAEAKAGLARARADAIRAKRDLERALELFEDDVVSTAVIDERRADRDASAAAVEAARAAVRSAELDLSYCQVRAPIAGRMARALVHVGNLVGESGQDTILAELVQEDPIHVYFAASEEEASSWPRVDPSGPGDARPRDPIPVRVRLGDGTSHPHEGFLDYRAPTVDALRGTISMRALIPNPDGTLRPGQFAQVIAVLPEIPDAVLIPQRAILDEQGGSYVLVVDQDDIAKRRPVHLGRTVDGMQQVVDGLTGGERVIVDGVQGVRSGDPVRVRSSETAEAGG
jgi:membrane fusion protein (multidrug efflux system)